MRLDRKKFAYTAVGFAAVAFGFVATSFGDRIDVSTVKHQVQATPETTPAALRFVIEAKNHCEGKAGEHAGDVTCSTGVYDSGIGLRNEHIRQYIESQKFPTSRLVYTATQGVMSGSLTFHGVTTEVTGTVSVQDGQLVILFDLDLSKHGVEVKKYLGIGIEPVLKIRAAMGDQVLPTGDRI